MRKLFRRGSQNGIEKKKNEDNFGEMNNNLMNLCKKCMGFEIFKFLLLSRDKCAVINQQHS